MAAAKYAGTGFMAGVPRWRRGVTGVRFVARAGD
jgi:hypothetical protein